MSTNSYEIADEDDILRCSYENNNTATTTPATTFADGGGNNHGIIIPHYNNGKEKDEDQVTEYQDAEEFEDILRCSYERSDYSDDNNVNVIRRREVMEGVPFHDHDYHEHSAEPALAGKQESHVAPPSVPLPLQLENNMNSAPSNNNLRVVSKNTREQRGNRYGDNGLLICKEGDSNDDTDGRGSSHHNMEQKNSNYATKKRGGGGRSIASLKRSSVGKESGSKNKEQFSLAKKKMESCYDEAIDSDDVGSSQHEKQKNTKYAIKKTGGGSVAASLKSSNSSGNYAMARRGGTSVAPSLRSNNSNSAKSGSIGKESSISLLDELEHYSDKKSLYAAILARQGRASQSTEDEGGGESISLLEDMRRAYNNNNDTDIPPPINSNDVAERNNNEGLFVKEAFPTNLDTILVNETEDEAGLDNNETSFHEAFHDAFPSISILDTFVPSNTTPATIEVPSRRTASSSTNAHHVHHSTNNHDDDARSVTASSMTHSVISEWRVDGTNRQHRISHEKNIIVGNNNDISTVENDNAHESVNSPQQDMLGDGQIISNSSPEKIAEAEAVIVDQNPQDGGMAASFRNPTPSPTRRRRSVGQNVANANSSRDHRSPHSAPTRSDIATPSSRITPKATAEELLFSEEREETSAPERPAMIDEMDENNCTTESKLNDIEGGEMNKEEAINHARKNNGDSSDAINKNRGSKECLDLSQKTAITSNATTMPPDHKFHSKGKEGLLDLSQKTAITSNTTTKPRRRAVDASSRPGSDLLPTINDSHAHDYDDAATAAYSAASSEMTQPQPSSIIPQQQFNGWNVPLGVQKIICSVPGLIVTTQVHRRSSPVIINDDEELIIPPGSYVEVLETRVHGERVRGRICWEIEEEDHEDSKGGKKKKSTIKKKATKVLKKQTSQMLKKQSTSFRNNVRKLNSKKRNDYGKSSDELDEEASSSAVHQGRIVKKYEGWISLQWANEYNGFGSMVSTEDVGVDKIADAQNLVITDEDSGPWTEPVMLGVYRTTSRGGLPLHESSKPDSEVICKLDHGRCIEVVQTQVKCDGVVLARVILSNIPSQSQSQSSEDNDIGGGRKFTSGWIDLLNSHDTKSSSSSVEGGGASPIPLGAYVIVADEPDGYVISEGSRLDSKEKGTLPPGSCMEVVATRMEEGVVRGLIASGGHVTLFVPSGINKKVVSFDDDTADGREGDGGGSRQNIAKNDDEGRMFAMPVPLGTYQIVEDRISVTGSLSSTSPLVMRLSHNAVVEILETHVVEGRDRVRGRIRSCHTFSSSSGNSGGDVSGWITLFEVRRNRMRMYAHPKQQQ